MIKVDENRCPKNHYCPITNICSAITQKDINSAPVIDKEKCTKCGRCVNLCAFRAFIIE